MLAGKQNAISQVFVTKITKAFLDALYAFLDGLVHLASDESPLSIGAGSGSKSLPPASTGVPGSNPLELVKIDDPVGTFRYTCDVHSMNGFPT